jgi:hypothetical protein
MSYFNFIVMKNQLFRVKMRSSFKKIITTFLMITLIIMWVILLYYRENQLNN